MQMLNLLTIVECLARFPMPLTFFKTNLCRAFDNSEVQIGGDVLKVFFISFMSNFRLTHRNQKIDDIPSRQHQSDMLQSDMNEVKTCFHQFLRVKQEVDELNIQIFYCP